MSGTASYKQESYNVHPIGYVRRLEDEIQLQILEPYRPGLKQLEHFSHVMVLWWAEKMDTGEFRSMMQCKPPYAEEHLTGVFATRAEYRPNPVAQTTCKILAVDEQEGILTIANIDAYGWNAHRGSEGLLPGVRPRTGEPHPRLVGRLA